LVLDSSEIAELADEYPCPRDVRGDARIGSSRTVWILVSGPWGFSLSALADSRFRDPRSAVSETCRSPPARRSAHLRQHAHRQWL